jgi:16S rRNA (guanine527-N7)-methyltransferase
MDAPDRSSLPRRASSPERVALPHSVDATAPLDAVFAEVFERGLTQLGLILDASTRAAIEAHARLLLAWNEHVNLSGLRTAEQVARGHVLDSLVAVETLRGLGRARPSLLDLGSGGGYPGLPLAVALPARRAALVDSIGKKAAFLEVAAAAVSGALRAAPAPAKNPLELLVLAERAEDLANEHGQRETWDIVTARALGSVAEVAELGLPLVHVGGHVVCWKLAGTASGLAAEIAAATRVIQAAGGGTARVVNLPAAAAVGLAGHCLVVIRKRVPTPARYPRSPGERRRRPLP